MCGGSEQLEDLPVKDDVIDFRENRGCCRDCYCLLVFFACVVGMIAIFAVGFTQGNPKRLYAPMNSEGGFCGYDSEDENYTDYPDLQYVLYYNISDPTQGVCVEECPKPGKFCVMNDGSLTSANVRNCLEITDSIYYLDGVSTAELDVAFGNENTSQQAFKALSLDENYVIEDTVDLMNRCIPNVTSAISDLGLYGGLNNLFTATVSDIKEAWWLFLIAFFLALLLCIGILCCLRCCAKCVTWFIFVAAIVMLAILGIFLLYFGAKNAGAGLQSDKIGGIVFVVFGVVVLIAVVFTIFILIYLRKRISLATTMVQEASNILAHNKCLLLSPLVYTFIFLVSCVLILVTMVFFFSVSDLEREGAIRTVNLNYGSRAVTVFVLLCFLWLLFFLIGLNEYTISGTGVSHFFSRCAEERPRFPIARTLKTLLLHHLGSIAVGSFLIALVALVRSLILLIARRVKAAENKTLKQCLCCLACCCGCLQAAVEGLAERAYILVALQGKNFFTSAADALKVMLANPLRTAYLTAISKFLVFMAELFVTAVTVLITLLILRPDVVGAEKPFIKVMYWWFTALICAVEAFAVASIIFQVYDVLIDTIFFCFLYDEHMKEKYGMNYMGYSSRDLKEYMAGVDTTAADPAAAPVADAADANKDKNKDENKDADKDQNKDK